MDTLLVTFLFNIVSIIIFAFIYSFIPKHNFIPLRSDDNLMILDYIFYSTTIQSGVGLPDITAVTPLAKILAIIQQIILIGTSLIILRYFIKKHS
jgi:hypothetical protein